MSARSAAPSVTVILPNGPVTGRLGRPGQRQVNHSLPSSKRRQGQDVIWRVQRRSLPAKRAFADIAGWRHRGAKVRSAELIYDPSSLAPSAQLVAPEFGTNLTGCICLSIEPEITPMVARLVIVLVFSLVPATAFADRTEWRRYVISSTGANVDVPMTIFTEDAELPEGGIGRRFFTKDHRADLTVQSVPNPENDSPANFLPRRTRPSVSNIKE